MNFMKIVFMWTGFLTWYVALVVGIAKLLKRGRINAFGYDADDLRAENARLRSWLRTSPDRGIEVLPPANVKPEDAPSSADFPSLEDQMRAYLDDPIWKENDE